MKKLLITGFDPFGGETVNPSWEAVSRLKNEIGDFELHKLQIPTVYVKAAERAIECAERVCPDVILCIGQAGGRALVTPEVVAINLCEGNIADNEGNMLCGVPAIEGAPAAYFSTFDARKIVSALKEQGIPAALSYSAGAFVCNDTLYRLLHHFRNSEIKIGFIHIPYSTEQNKEPSLSLDEIVKGLTVAIESIDS